MIYGLRREKKRFFQLLKMSLWFFVLWPSCTLQLSVRSAALRDNRNIHEKQKRGARQKNHTSYAQFPRIFFQSSKSFEASPWRTRETLYGGNTDKSDRRQWKMEKERKRQVRSSFLIWQLGLLSWMKSNMSIMRQKIPSNSTSYSFEVNVKSSVHRLPQVWSHLIAITDNYYGFSRGLADHPRMDCALFSLRVYVMVFSFLFMNNGAVAPGPWSRAFPCYVVGSVTRWGFTDHEVQSTRDQLNG